MAARKEPGPSGRVRRALGQVEVLSGGSGRVGRDVRRSRVAGRSSSGCEPAGGVTAGNPTAGSPGPGRAIAGSARGASRTIDARERATRATGKPGRRNGRYV